MPHNIHSQTQDESVAIRFERIEKRFFGVQVLQDVSFALAAGRTLGVVGENGAGKSTLMNILAGNQRADAGRMRLFGEPHAPRDPGQASRRGVAFIHQELNLFSNLSIAENIFLTNFPTWPAIPWIRRGTLHQQAAALLARVGLKIRPETLVERLSPGERQLVEIAKALRTKARLMIFDEPTTSLTDRETAHLFQRIAQLREQGVTLIYISHNLSDVLRLCDDVLVLRDGAVVGQGTAAEFTPDQLVTLMVGRQLTQMFPPRLAWADDANLAARVCRPWERDPDRAAELGGSDTSGRASRALRDPDRAAPLLEVRGLSQPGLVHNINFSLRRGEILGLAGLMGAGRSELARLLFGLEPFACGEIRIEGRPLHPGPRRSIRRGMAFLTENRGEEGLCLEASIAENLVLARLPHHARGPLGWLDAADMAREVREIRGAVGLTATARDDQAAQTLSGGNQQKLILGKWLLVRPSILILDEPTRGIDVGARHEIYTLINELAARGAGVLMISSELEELMGLCDRILVMNQGEIRDELTRGEFDRERILKSALHERDPEGGVVVGAG